MYFPSAFFVCTSEPCLSLKLLLSRKIVPAPDSSLALSVGNKAAVPSLLSKWQMRSDGLSIRKRRERGSTLTELFTLLLHSWETLAGFPRLVCFLAQQVKNPESLQGKLDFYHTHWAAKSPKVTFTYSCKAASSPKVKSSIEVSKKGIVSRRQAKKENTDR